MVANLIRRAVLAAAMLGLVVGAAGRAKADYNSVTLTFDDVEIPQGQSTVPLANSYQGYVWDNFFVGNASYLSGINTPSGASGVVSENQAAYNGDGDPAYINSIPGTKFDLINAYLTAISAPQSVEVTGILGTASIFDHTYLVSNLRPTFFDFNITGVEKVKFKSKSGGQFVIDNIILNPVVPELDAFSTSSALTLLSSGVLMLNGRRKR